MTDRILVQDSEEEEEDVDIPPRAECEERCQQFAEITGTDTALAMFYLQDRKWILEEALNEFFQSQSGGNANLSSKNERSASCQSQTVQQPSSLASTISSFVSSSSSSSSTPSLANASSGTHVQTVLKSASKSEVPLLQPEKAGRVRVLSWNVDGLDPNNLISRTESVCRTLSQEKAEIVFLQEVVQRSYDILTTALPEYESFCGLDSPDLIPLGAYFTVMLLRKDCCTVEKVNVANFPGSQMERTLLEVECQVKGIPLTLLTSHLESTAEFSSERKCQLKIAFRRMTAQAADRTVIFGGDLNLRDKELTGESSKPAKVYDLWECTGKRPEAKFTWDLTINDNKQIGTRFQPKCRFDRLYIRHPEKSVQLKPVYFELTGIQRLSSCHRFASDHWAILAHLDIKAREG